MLDTILQSALAESSLELVGNVVYGFVRKIRQKKRIDPLDPLPQNTPVQLSEDQVMMLEELIKEVEEYYQNNLDQLSEEQVVEITTALTNAFIDRVLSESTYDENVISRRLQELRKVR